MLVACGTVEFQKIFVPPLRGRMEFNMGLRVVKRDGLPLWKRAILYLSAVVLALLIGAAILLFLGVNPLDYY